MSSVLHVGTGSRTRLPAEQQKKSHNCVGRLLPEQTDKRRFAPIRLQYVFSLYATYPTIQKNVHPGLSF